ncbi:hypothetical protein ADIWIN_1539 [Winogradskyella psychrotolerans RS-3]|uniref:Uncharacterized protein n=1 Tax=Winogradskyella psychrotolerans RS-3 TaxID=641526 RepID=S7X3A6_9FLAO|nr:hypothetical protein [Winogradskyella psychrotolerans]EPR73509.1 hypothetical protein ADIWIN_1539 [Winogradskyella psychrotolerans RS-3]
MKNDKKDKPKTEHKKRLHQNATDDKGPLKDDHYNQYGKQNETRRERAEKLKED